MSASSSRIATLLELSDAIVELIAGVLPSTASVWVNSSNLTSGGSGSGWVYDANHVITNHHVVEKQDRKVRVRLPSRIEMGGTVVGSDNETDLAVIAVTADDLMPLVIRREMPPRLGEICFAIGAPLGEFEESVSMGIVSGLGRQAHFEGRVLEELVQIDGTTTSGNSGGPLIDAAGHLIGVVVGGRQNAGTINFAIPAETVLHVVPEIIKYGDVRRAGLGVSVSAIPVTVEGRARRAVEVQRVVDDSPLEPGDVILAVNGKKIERRYDLIRELGRHVIRTDVEILVYRSERVITLSARTIERPQ
jgi:S1-C subfamily serine protease